MISPLVHPTAVVHPKAQLDPSVRVGPYCVIGEGASIGPYTSLHNHVTVQGPCVIGAHNQIYPYAVLGADPQDLKYRGGATSLVIGDHNQIREHATIHRGTEAGGGRTVIGSHCIIMVGVHVAHDCIIEDQVIIANGSMLGGHCHLEFGAWLAGGVGVHHFVTVGTLGFVGGYSRITHDVPPFVLVEGSPAVPRTINVKGLMRRHWDAREIDRLRAAFRLIFRDQDTPAIEAIHQLRQEPDQAPHVLKLCAFLERMEMGIHGRQAERLRGSDSRTGS